MNEYLNVLWAVKKQAQSYQSDYVRKHIRLVNEASSRGHISCLSTAGKNMGFWSLTTAGQLFLNTYGGAV
ncbi:fusion protein [Pseudomonas phage phi 21A]|nr:fusion protein [Pseudomonas phage phi 21A]